MDRAQFAQPFFAYGMAVDTTSAMHPLTMSRENAVASAGQGFVIADSDGKASGWIRLGFPVAVSLGLWVTIFQMVQISI